MKNISILLMILLLFTGCSLKFSDDPDHADSKGDDVHYHAGLFIHVDDVRQDYSAFEYMAVKPCSGGETRPVDLTDVTERIHLHDQVGHVAHIHAPSVTWRELFESLEIEELFDIGLTTAYRDRELDMDLIDTTIRPYETANFFFGVTSSTDTMIDIVSRKEIEEIEAQLESCGS